MKKITSEEKTSFFIFFGAWIAYTLIGFGKYNYSATISYIVSQNVFSKSNAGTIAASFYFFYALAQIFASKLADKKSPFFTVKLGIVCSLIINLLMCFTQNFVAVLVLWSLNGLLQFGVWPGVSRIISVYLLPEHKKKASVYIGFGLSVGGVLSFVSSAFLLKAFGWYGTFGASALVMVPTFFLWQRVEKSSKNVVIEKTEIIENNDLKTEKKNDISKLSLYASSGLFFAFIMSVGINMLGTGLKAWVPTLIMESYHTSASLSNGLTAILLITDIVGMILFSKILTRVKNEMLGRGVLCMLSLIPVIILQFIGAIPLALAIAMLAITSVLAIMNTPMHVGIASTFEKYGCSAQVAGLINAFASIGVMAANGGFGIIADLFGWSTLTHTWVVIILVCIVLSFFTIGKWRKFKEM